MSPGRSGAADNANALGEFLRARRRRMDAQDLGLSLVGRRGSGLRRDELAARAGVSSPYYTRLEQGRDRHPSPQVVEALGRALELDQQALSHLRALAGTRDFAPRSPTPAEQVPAGVLRLVDSTAEPALVVSRYRDVLASNRVARLLSPAFAVSTNLLEHAFTSPDRASLYPDWEDVALDGVAGLRASVGTASDDPRLTALVSDLSRRSPVFADMWARHDVGRRADGLKRYGGTPVGTIRLSYQTLAVPDAPGQTLYTLFAEPGSPDEQALEELKRLAGQELTVDRRRSAALPGQESNLRR